MGNTPNRVHGYRSPGNDDILTLTMSDDYQLRTHRPGDLGWIVHRHGVLYHQEQGWNQNLEAVVAKAVSEFLFDPDERKCCLVAERDGEILGSVMLMRDERYEEGDVARLRLLLVEPAARGLGLGRRLVQEVIRFCREAGYRKITLFTDQRLETARRLYAGHGFQMTKSESHTRFGPDCVGETWELEL